MLLDERSLLSAGELVRFREQQQLARVAEPRNQLLVERGERMARIHDHHYASETGTVLQIRADQRLPLFPHRLRDARIPVPRQVDEPRGPTEIIEIDGLGAARGLAGAGKPLAPQQRVDRARLANVRAPGEGDLRGPGRR
jgi:hypothetical protein